MSEQQAPPEQVQIQMRPPREVRYINTDIVVADPAPDGSREMSFVTKYNMVGHPEEFTTFILPKDAQDHIVKRFSGGIEIAQPGDVPAPPPEA